MFSGACRHLWYICRAIAVNWRLQLRRWRRRPIWTSSIFKLNFIFILFFPNEMIASHNEQKKRKKVWATLLFFVRLHLSRKWSSLERLSLLFFTQQKPKGEIKFQKKKKTVASWLYSFCTLLYTEARKHTHISVCTVIRLLYIYIYLLRHLDVYMEGASIKTKVFFKLAGWMCALCARVFIFITIHISRPVQ